MSYLRTNNIKEILFLGHLLFTLSVSAFLADQVSLPGNQTTLFEAIMNNDVLHVETLLKKGSSLEMRDKNGSTALHIAVEKGNELIVKMLLNGGARKKARNQEGKTALHLAAGNGFIECMNTLLKEYKTANTQADDGSTPLHVAVSCGQIECTELLLKAGANPNAFANKSVTPLHSASRVGNLACLKLLSSSGGDREAQDKHGLTPLHYAADEGHSACVIWLLSQGSEKDAQTLAGLTPSHLAAGKGHTDCLKILINFGASLQLKAINSFTVLEWANFRSHTDCIKLLLDKRAHHVNTESSNESALHWAAYRANTINILNILILEGSSVHDRNAKGLTPLHRAAQGFRMDNLELLLKKGSHIDAQDNEGMTPLHHAAKFGRDGAVRVLLAHGAFKESKDSVGHWTPLFFAVCVGNTECAQLLLENGASADAVDIQRRTLLHIACNGSRECFALLLNKGLQFEACDLEQRTPLHLAATQETADYVQMLIDVGASVDSRTAQGETPLMYAANAERPECIDLLIQSGASLASVDTWQKTVLHHAVTIKRDTVDGLKLLIKKGAPLEDVDKGGYTPLLFASFRGNNQAVNILIDAGANIHKVCEIGRCTILHLCALHHDITTMRKLIDKGMSINCVDQNGRTPLHLIVSLDRANEDEVGEMTECIKLLLDNGAQLEVVDRYGRTALQNAADRGYVSCFRELLKRKLLSQSQSSSSWLSALASWWYQRTPEKRECPVVLMLGNSWVNGHTQILELLFAFRLNLHTSLTAILIDIRVISPESLEGLLSFSYQLYRPAKEIANSSRKRLIEGILIYKELAKNKYLHSHLFHSLEDTLNDVIIVFLDEIHRGRIFIRPVGSPAYLYPLFNGKVFEQALVTYIFKKVRGEFEEVRRSDKLEIFHKDQFVKPTPLTEKTKQLISVGIKQKINSVQQGKSLL